MFTDGGVVTRELYELRGVPVKDIQMGGRFIAILAKGKAFLDLKFA